ncbi:MAG TPA: type II toxin-antitoxin system prevent-host-death family antitoxin [Burkholderiaceae bacterium]|nr:type II toxin-antitoxin system prevent-host-death family antitoxin [Burkholderiaceae bacterium]
MSVTTLSSREFNQDTAGAKKAARKGPVVITDRGQPAHVLITYERYRELTAGDADIVTMLAMPEAASVAFRPARVGAPYRRADLG